ncbi:MAG: helicase-related protein [Dehalococcoidales bacterium]|nr:helicase-related protein [Dehalococcoidales bacterium]
MAKLDDLKEGASVIGIVADRPVTIIHVKWFGQQAVELTFKDEHTGKVDNRLLYRTDENNLTIQEKKSDWAYDGDGETFRLVSEANRINMAYLFDPRLAVHISQVDPLPHQIAAVYENMLPRQPLHYLLADDPGAGKTIMAGLLIKELILRGDLERCLIVCPANLAEQWQDELNEKFKLYFEIVGKEQIEGNLAVNPFSEKSLVISRLDLLKPKRDRNGEQDESRLGLLKQVDWDLIVVDEAHKMSASFVGGDVKLTARYRLGQVLCDPQYTRNVLFLTATPHHGKEEDFQLFLALLDKDRFEGRFRTGVHAADISDIMRRMLKEELVDFEGRPLFPERRAYTRNYKLSPLENRLYNEVTEYVRKEMSRADILAQESKEGVHRRTVVGFALTVLQRRLASSPEAIYQSLKRRRERLEQRVKDEKLKGTKVDIDLTAGLRTAEDEDIDDLPDEETEQLEEQVVDQASSARTIAELESEVKRLKDLESLAKEVRQSETDCKWLELQDLLQNRTEMFDEQRHRHKLIIFTEHRDTLRYLANKVRNLLGNPAAVIEIHGGLGRVERRRAQNTFVNDPVAEILIATDAAGEGINLQRAHLMVNYDLPWNPNRIEQRFGRIHRLGQREVCHLWNMVAYETREGAVFHKLFDKLEVQRQALKGKVFDVLGQVFEEVSLKDLLLEAIRYGDQPEVKARLEQRIDFLMSPERYRQLLEQYALAKDTIDATHLQIIKEEMERAAALRLQPHFVASFFMDAFSRLGGSVQEREPNRYEIRRIPREIVRKARDIKHSYPLAPRYDRIVFDKSLVNLNDKPQAEFVAMGHPLLDATIKLTMDRHAELLRRGTILIDARDKGPDEIRALFFIQQEIHDNSLDRDKKHNIVSRKIYFIEVDTNGNVRDVGAAPYLDYRAPTANEKDRINRLPSRQWLQSNLEDIAKSFAVESLIPASLQETKDYREHLILKTMAAVKERLTKEIQYWDTRAEELKSQELAGKQPRMNSGQARKRADDLTIRLENRMKDLDLQRQLLPQSPIIVGGAVIIPEKLLKLAKPGPDKPVDKEARDRIEELAMKAVEDAEKRAGRIPTRMPPNNPGYDIESKDPVTGHLFFIEVKGRVADANTIHITKNEWLVALNKREMFILAIGRIRNDEIEDLHYISDPMARAIAGDLTFGLTGIDLSINDLLKLETKLMEN